MKRKMFIRMKKNLCKDLHLFPYKWIFYTIKQEIKKFFLNEVSVLFLLIN